MTWENRVMGQAKDCAALLTPSRAGPSNPSRQGGLGGGEAASGLPTPQPWGQEPSGHIRSWTRYSRALTKLSDLSQELKGTLFGLKTVSFLDF